MDSVPIDDREPIRHPDWCDQERCEVQLVERVWHRTPSRTIGQTTVYGELSHTPPSAPERWIAIVHRACACSDECEPTDTLMLSYADARGLYGALGVVLAEMHQPEGDQ